MRSGDWVSIEYLGRKVEGQVMMSSGNGKSLMLEFEALLDGYLGQMPVLQGEDGVYRDLLFGHPVILTEL